MPEKDVPAFHWEVNNLSGRRRWMEKMARKYGEAAQDSVEKAMHKMKRGQLKSGAEVEKPLKVKNRQLQLGFLKREKKELKFHQRKISPF